MRKSLALGLAIILGGTGLCPGQVGGNIGYAQGGGKGRAEQKEQAKRILTQVDLPPTGNSTFVEADVMMNVKPDEYVAVFGVQREGETAAECNKKMNATVKELTDALKPLGVGGDALFVDFVAQNKIYGYELAGDVAREKLVGFELKKNVSIRYRDRDLLDKFVLAAANAEVFDLIKVDCVVKDVVLVREGLTEKAAMVIKQKAARYEKLLGIKLKPPAQVYAEKAATYYPTEMYDSYTAFESESVNADGPVDRRKYTIKATRKGKTFFYNALDAGSFDDVINPVVVEPVVQFTLYLKVKYEVEQDRAK